VLSPITTRTGLRNAFSIDVEDYFHVEALSSVVDRSQWSQLEYRAEASTQRILELLAAESVRATFFILGWVAKRSPQLVRAIHAALASSREFEAEYRVIRPDGSHRHVDCRAMIYRDAAGNILYSIIDTYEEIFGTQG